MTPEVRNEEAKASLKALLEGTLPPRGRDKITACSDLWANAKISPVLRDAALKLQGADLYKKIKPPGDITLYKPPPAGASGPESAEAARAGSWELQPLVHEPAPANQAPQYSVSELCRVCALIPGPHVLPEELKGTRVQPGQPSAG